MRKFFRLLTLSGISATIMGVITGSWFGNLFTAKEFPTYKLGIAPLLLSIRQLDPLGRHMLLFLGLAIGIGFIQIFWGRLIRLFYHLWNRYYKEALFDSFPPVLFAFGLVVIALFSVKAGLVVCCAALLMILFFAGRRQKKIISRMGEGIWGMYSNVTGFLSDLLSYSRLFALGLASSILASVTNILAFIVSGIPFAGGILCVLFLLIAHTLNLAINVLGAFIHTTRLQFVEFFQQFDLSGGGQKFEPLIVKERFITVKDNHNEP